MARNPHAVTWWSREGIAGQFKRSVGYRLGSNGRGLTRAVFYLGADRRTAEQEAARIYHEWQLLKAEGHAYWPPARLAAIHARLGGQPARAAPAVPVESPPPSEPTPTAEASAQISVDATALTVRQARALYAQDAEARMNAGEITRGRYTVLDINSRTAAEKLGMDVPLADVGGEALRNAARHFLGLPVGKAGKNGKAKPISPRTAQNIISELRMMVKWWGEHEVIDWRPPKNANALMPTKRKHGVSVEEQDRRHARAFGKRVETIEPGTLQAIYAHAHPTLKACIACGINFGWYGVDCADLAPRHVKTDGDRTLIEWIRYKTGVQVVYVAWPETVEALKAAKAPPNEHGRWLLTPRTRTPLKTRESEKDWVREAWNRAKTAAGLRDLRLGFSCLRDTSADVMRQLEGREVADLHIAHAEHSMVGHYTNPLMDRHHRGLQAMRGHFASVWSPPATKGP